jgi:hypothetical protein
MKQGRWTIAAIPLVLLLAGCAGMEGSGDGVASGGSDLITREQLEQAGRANAYEAIEFIRPQWLRARSEQSVLNPTGIQVYLNDSRYGDLQSLRNITTHDIVTIRRYSATAASQRWGPGHSEGVIAVSTRTTQ